MTNLLSRGDYRLSLSRVPNNSQTLDTRATEWHIFNSAAVHFWRDGGEGVGNIDRNRCSSRIPGGFGGIFIRKKTEPALAPSKLHSQAALFGFGDNLKCSALSGLIRAPKVHRRVQGRSASHWCTVAPKRRVNSHEIDRWERDTDVIY